MGNLLEKLSAMPTAQKFMLLLLLLGGIGAAWYFTMIADVEERIENVRGQTQRLTRELADADAKLTNLRRFEEEVELLKKQRDDMRDRLPADEEIASLLAKIHGQAKIVGLEISRFERTAAEARELYVRIPVKMTLQGSFHQIATFFYYVGKLTRLVNVESIELAADKREAGGNMLRASCVATTFMYRSPDAAGGPVQ